MASGLKPGYDLLGFSGVGCCVRGDEYAQCCGSAMAMRQTTETIRGYGGVAARQRGSGSSCFKAGSVALKRHGGECYCQLHPAPHPDCTPTPSRYLLP